MSCSDCDGRGGRWWATECSREFRMCEKCVGEGNPLWTDEDRIRLRMHQGLEQECEAAAMAALREQRRR